jgi:hypothetical protein
MASIFYNSNIDIGAVMSYNTGYAKNTINCISVF